MAVTIDFVAFDDEKDACLLVLVEPGPWDGAAVEDRLRALQDRLYGCLEAALDGQVAERFPKALKKKVVIRVDCYECYGAVREEVDDFMQRFSIGVRDLPDYSPAASEWVQSFEFEVNHDQIH